MVPWGEATQKNTGSINVNDNVSVILPKTKLSRIIRSNGWTSAVTPTHYGVIRIYTCGVCVCGVCVCVCVCRCVCARACVCVRVCVIRPGNIRLQLCPRAAQS